MPKPILTVCLITYNQKKYIRQAVDSILSQKVNFDWELAIADDCSTDGTREILQEYKKRHPKLITLILQEKNVGPEANWFDLITYPKTKYMLYGEGDDYFTDDSKLQVQVDFLESHPDYTICFHPERVFYENHEHEDYTAPSKEERGKGDLEQLIKGNFLYTNSVMFKRRDYNSISRGIIPMDWYLHLFNAQFGKIGFIDKVMSAYRRHPGSIWWNATKDVDKIWSSYGLAHMAMFVEMQKLYGDSSKYRQIILKHIDSAFDRLASADSKYGSNQLIQVVERFPDITANYIMRQDLVRTSHKSTERLRSELEDAKKKLHEAQLQNDQLMSELTVIKSSKLWKFRETIVKTVPRI